MAVRMRCTCGAHAVHMLGHVAGHMQGTGRASAGHVQGMHLGGTLQSLPRSCSVIELSLPILDLQ